MKKYLSIFVLVIIQSQLAWAQPKVATSSSINGVVVYKQKINLSFPDFQKDTLWFNRTKSIFYWNTANFSGNAGFQKMKKKYPNAKSGGHIAGAGIRMYYGLRVNLLNTAADSLFSLMGMKYIGKLLYLKEKIPKINWHIQDSTKQIGNYTVKKAIAHFRGHDYTVWFTSEIPLPYGPWKLHGLPGLILQAYDHSGMIRFSAQKVVLRKKELVTVPSIPLNGEENTIDIIEYKHIMHHYKRLQKKHAMKLIRQIPGISKKDRMNMHYHLQPIRHMEIFNEG
jgi:GLPGLI family protein